MVQTKAKFKWCIRCDTVYSGKYCPQCGFYGYVPPEEIYAPGLNDHAPYDPNQKKNKKVKEPSWNARLNHK